MKEVLDINRKTFVSINNLPKKAIILGYSKNSKHAW